MLVAIFKTLSPKVLTSLIASYIKDILSKITKKLMQKPTAPTPLTFQETETILETTTTTTTKTITKTHTLSNEHIVK